MHHFCCCLQSLENFTRIYHHADNFCCSPEKCSAISGFWKHFYYIFRYFPVYYVIFIKKNYKYVGKIFGAFNKVPKGKKLFYSVLSDFACLPMLLISILFCYNFFHTGFISIPYLTSKQHQIVNVGRNIEYYKSRY